MSCLTFPSKPFVLIYEYIFGEGSTVAVDGQARYWLNFVGTKRYVILSVSFGISCTIIVSAINFQLYQLKAQCLLFIVPAATQEILHKQDMDLPNRTTAVTIIRLL